MNWNEPLREVRFDTKEHACAFSVLINNDSKIRLTGRAKYRKSLPEFKGIVCRDFSVFYTAFAMPDSIEVAKLAKTAIGRVSRDPKTSLRVVVEYKAVTEQKAV